MGMEFVLSMRSPLSLHGFAFYTHRAPPGSLLTRAVSFCDPKRRRISVVAAGAYNSSFANNSEGNSDWRFRSSLDCTLNQEEEDDDDRHRHAGQRSSEIGRQSSRVELGFSFSGESDSGDTEKEKEHVHGPNSFSHDVECFSPVKGEKTRVDLSCAGGAVAGVGLPLSLRMLKRKQQGHGKSTLASGLAEVGNSLLNAFSSMVFMMKTLQSHTLHIRQQFFEQEIEGLLNQVQREMHASFLWLFQQVFSCTPELMVLVMVLLADFTVFSMADNLHRPPISPSTPSVAMVSALPNSMDTSDAALFMNRSGEGFRSYFKKSLTSSPSLVDNVDQFHNGSGWVGNGGRRSHIIAGGADGDSDPSRTSVSMNKAVFSLEDNLPSELSSMAAASLALQELTTSQEEVPSSVHSSSVEDIMPSDFSAMTTALVFEELSTVEDLSKSDALSVSISNALDDSVQAVGSTEAAGHSNFVLLDQGTMQSLVAPFTAWVEDDNYSCYDRTDLAYQYAISSDSMNSMLLANYAQFLFLVRKDHDRAEELFRRAVLCDPFDGDAISRFASFLWLARHNLAAAEKAYQAAVRADPSNSFHAANYAHFLWNSGQ